MRRHAGLAERLGASFKMALLAVDPDGELLDEPQICLLSCRDHPVRQSARLTAATAAA